MLSLDTSTLTGFNQGNSETVTIFGEGFGTEQNIYACFTRYSNTSAECLDSGLTLYDDASSNISTELIFSGVNLNFDVSGSDVYVAIGFQSGDAEYSEFAMIGTLVSIDDTSTTVAVSQNSEFYVTVQGTGFYSTNESKYALSLTTDDCTSISVSQFIYTSSTELVAVSNTSSCTGILYATLNYNTQGDLDTTGVGTILTFTDTSESQSVYTLTDTTLTLTASSGSIFASKNGTFLEYTVTFNDGEGTCSGGVEGTINSDSSSSSELIVVADLSTCSMGNILSASVSLTNFPSGSSQSADVATLIEVYDTSTSQGLPQDSSSTTVTLTGIGFGLSEASNYDVSMSSSDSGCSISPADGSSSYTVSRISTSELTVDVALSDCSGSATLSVALSYSNLGAMSEVIVGTFIDITDYSTLEPLDDISSIEIPVHGAGFGSTELSDYTITFSGTDCGEGAEETYTATSRASDTLLFFAAVDLTSCSSLVYGTYEVTTLRVSRLVCLTI